MEVDPYDEDERFRVHLEQLQADQHAHAEAEFDEDARFRIHQVNVQHHPTAASCAKSADHDSPTLVDS